MQNSQQSERIASVKLQYLGIHSLYQSELFKSDKNLVIDEDGQQWQGAVEQEIFV